MSFAAGWPGTEMPDLNTTTSLKFWRSLRPLTRKEKILRLFLKQKTT